MNKILRLLYNIKKEGVILGSFIYIKKIINKLFNILVFNRIDINIDYTSQIYGIKHIQIGKNFHTGKCFRLEAVEMYGNKKYTPQIIIKDNVVINDFVHIGCTNYIEIGNHVLMASKIYISDHNHGYYSGEKQSSPIIEPERRIVSNDKSVIIGDNTWLGEGVVILPGVNIGEGCIIGANAVVSKNIPDYSIAVGVPAKVIKKYNFNTKKWEQFK